MQALGNRRSAQAARSCGAARPRRSPLVVRAAKTANGPSIAIVGVTGAVGQEFLTVGTEIEAALC